MLVVHAIWTEGALQLWAESPSACRAFFHDAGGRDAEASAATHPFAASAEELRAALAEVLEPITAPESDSVRMRLPAADEGVLPSEQLAGRLGLYGHDPKRLHAVDVPTLRVLPGDAPFVLFPLENGERPEGMLLGHGTRYWIAVARFVAELLSDQRFLPTLLQSPEWGLRAEWHPWLQDNQTRDRAARLLEAMPPVARAVVDDFGHQPWSVLEDALRSLTDAIVRNALIADDYEDAIDGRDPLEDAHVLWLTGLLGRRSGVEVSAGAASALLRDVSGWLANLDEAGRGRGARLGFTLEEPPPDTIPDGAAAVVEDVRWRLAFNLVGVGRHDDDGPIVTAERIWSDPAGAAAVLGGGVRHPEEILVADLGRAARIVPDLESALTDAHPTGLDLTTSAAYRFLAEHRGVLEEAGYAVEVPDWWDSPAARIGAQLNIESAATEGGAGVAGDGADAAGALVGLASLVRYHWSIAVGDQPLSMDEFERLAQAAAKGSLVRIKGRWVELKPEQVADAAALLEARPGGETTLLDALRLAHGAAGGALGSNGLAVTSINATGWVGDLLGSTTDSIQISMLDQPVLFRGSLRPYQLTGLSWLAFLDHYGLGACLADDMGLGKTIQLIALLQWERARAERGETGPVGPTLLVAPTSVVSNWRRELERFAPELTVHVQHGPDRPVGDEFLDLAARTDVVLTTYTLVSRDRETLLRRTWHRVVLDEAQYIKNPPTKQTSTIRALQTSRRVALTGTPVENRLTELWSIMEFCNPGYVGSAAEFRRYFAVPIERHRDAQRAEELRRLVRPFILRRLKTDPGVVDDLPPCVTTREYATLTPEQARLYEQAVGSMLDEVDQAEGIRRRGLVLATLVKLKQICNHPAQALGDADLVEGAERGLAERSGKCARILEMLEEVRSTGDRALVFTQFRRMGTLLETMIRGELDSEVLFLHGGTPRAKRQEMIDRFQDPEGGVPIFVLSLRAGGVGLNLTAANHVFHFDRWWNPAVESQATDRAFRIGQTRKVHVHKFVCLGTLEERIDQMLEQKTELAQNVIGAGEQWITELSTQQLRSLFALERIGAMGVEVAT